MALSFISKFREELMVVAMLMVVWFHILLTLTMELVVSIVY